MYMSDLGLNGCRYCIVPLAEANNPLMCLLTDRKLSSNYSDNVRKGLIIYWLQFVCNDFLLL